MGEAFAGRHSCQACVPTRAQLAEALGKCPPASEESASARGGRRQLLGGQAGARGVQPASPGSSPDSAGPSGGHRRLSTSFLSLSLPLCHPLRACVQRHVTSCQDARPHSYAVPRTCGWLWALRHACGGYPQPLALRSVYTGHPGQQDGTGSLMCHRGHPQEGDLSRSPGRPESGPPNDQGSAVL